MVSTFISSLSPQESAALITAIAAGVLAVANTVVTVATAILSNRYNSRTQRELEQLKARYQRDAATDAFMDTRLAEGLESLAAAIRAIQVVKDAIRHILEAENRTMKGDEAAKAFTLAKEGMFSGYQQHLAPLEGEAKGIFHDAKNASLVVERAVRSAMRSKRWAEGLSPELRAELQQQHARLTGYQEQLRQRYAARIDERSARDA